jgi:hypothetical protein
MNKSKLFLSMTTIFLAIAAVAATKGKKSRIVTGYYSIGNGCTQGVSNACTISGPKICTCVTTGNTHVRLFTYRPGSCVNYLFMK